MANGQVALHSPYCRPIRHERGDVEKSTQTAFELIQMVSQDVHNNNYMFCAFVRYLQFNFSFNISQKQIFYLYF